jgi:hypothetical protein
MAAIDPVTKLPKTERISAIPTDIRVPRKFNMEDLDHVSVVSPTASGFKQRDYGHSVVETIQRAIDESRITTSSGSGTRSYPDSESIAFQQLSSGSNVCTIARSAGSCIITVPSNVDKLSTLQLVIDAGGGDQGGDSSYTIDFTYGGTRTFNQNADLSDAEIPVVQMLIYTDTGKVTRTTSEAMEITRPSAGTLRINFLNALTSGSDKRQITFNF